MNTKKFLTVSVVVCSLLFLVGCGGAKKTTTTTGDVTTVTDTTTTTNVGNKKAATKDQCLELMAFAFKFSQIQAQGDNAAAMVWAQKANDLEIKYGSDNIDYDTSCSKFLANDPSFMKAVQKYMAELK